MYSTAKFTSFACSMNLSLVTHVSLWWLTTSKDDHTVMTQDNSYKVGGFVSPRCRRCFPPPMTCQGGLIQLDPGLSYDLHRTSNVYFCSLFACIRIYRLY